MIATCSVLPMMISCFAVIQVGVVAEALMLTGSIHDYPVVPECDLNVNLSKLLETGNLSDVTLAVGEREFKAHKAILSGIYM